ncbi:DUF1918 domain-containing protein [Georgenia sp. 311]|uniref:DUF1918 domain-containing protein n=1 Tax=Georgenia wutianyii TaxID=2585135 RepID=A0ABX5VIV7_9MICO|nr:MULTISPECIES: DUF1918 domain-containing protein [Georgenia]QDB77985.1 DUF1918 domain-containing protein [Georgenia wutianyii]TNC18177.1 DUF1918 domain-containing protein [Georgenia sp. 311]
MAPVEPGDRIVVNATHVGGHTRDGEVLAVHGQGGTPPYLVRWSDTGAESLFFPGSDSVVHSGGVGEPT